MDYIDVCMMPDSTTVRLLDGRFGRVCAWYHNVECIGVRVGERFTVVHSRNLILDAVQDDVLVEIEPRAGRAAAGTQ